MCGVFYPKSGVFIGFWVVFWVGVFGPWGGVLGPWCSGHTESKLQVPTKVDIKFTQDYIYIFFWKKTVSRHFSIPICLQEKESLNRRNSRKIWLIFVVLRYININSWTWKVFEMNFKYKNINPNYILLLIGGQPRRMYETFICIHQGEWFKGSRRWPILHPWQENG